MPVVLTGILRAVAGAALLALPRFQQVQVADQLA